MSSDHQKNPVISVAADSLAKKFNGIHIFRNIGFGLRTGQSLSVTGPNGAGKSTLLEIIAGVRRATSGTIAWSIDAAPVPGGVIRGRIGFTSPRINPYGELTGSENLHFAAHARGCRPDTDELLHRFGLYAHRNKAVKRYSSGMRQRLRIILALLHDPGVLILDEPGSNLDIAGKDILYASLNALKNDRILIIATNDAGEARLCDGGVTLA